LGAQEGRSRLIACPVCGLRIGPGGPPCPNDWCRRADRCFSVVFSLGVHAGALRHALLRYKYKRELWLSEVFARSIATYLEDHAAWFEEFDLVTGVPSYSGAGARRDWDPVGAILAALGPMLEPGWQVATGAVTKTAETRPMQRLGRSERRALAAGALRRALVVESPRLVQDARVLVVDDVMTDGCTLREVARALRRAGALEVAGLVLARLPWVDRRPV
jgi:predicted amidophosphoribosyltransferase